MSANDSSGAKFGPQTTPQDLKTGPQGTPKVTPGAQMNPGDAPRRPAAPPGAPGHPQPPARGHQGVRLGSQKTMLPPMKYLTFPLCAPRRRRPRGDRAPDDNWDPLITSAPCPTPLKPTLLELTFCLPGPRTPGWLIAPHASGPSGVGGLTGLRPLPPTPEKTSGVNSEELLPLREGRASFSFELTAHGLLPLQ